MDIYNYITKDHKKVKQLFQKLIINKSAAKRKGIFQEIKRELLLHAKTENATFYEALRQGHEEAIANHGKEEHDEVEKLIKKLDKTRSNTISWFIQIGELKRLVEHHVKEEENKMFEKAKNVFSEETAEKLAEEMENLKRKKFSL